MQHHRIPIHVSTNIVNIPPEATTRTTQASVRTFGVYYQSSYPHVYHAQLSKPSKNSQHNFQHQKIYQIQIYLFTSCTTGKPTTSLPQYTPQLFPNMHFPSFSSPPPTFESKSVSHTTLRKQRPRCCHQQQQPNQPIRHCS